LKVGLKTICGNLNRDFLSGKFRELGQVVLLGLFVLLENLDGEKPNLLVDVRIPEKVVIKARFVGYENVSPW
jgi:hypothetical protein